MSWYADQLLRPATKVIVLLVFIGYLGLCIYCTTQLTQEFRVPDYVPQGSHVEPFFRTFEDYSTLFRQIGVYFRNVDQSDPDVQMQMIDYVEQLSQLEQIGGPPGFFWVRDFADMATSQQAIDLNLQNKTFEEQIDLALGLPQVQDGYGSDIVRDPVTGEITASRCFIFLRKIDMNSVPDQIDMLMDQRAISARQPINRQSQDGWSFFTFEELYFFFELYAVSVQELVFTTIAGVCAVSVVAFLFIPHWSAITFVTPLICCLYFLLLGMFEFCSVSS
jgi:Niemann-Pick C1 protein